MYVKLIFFCMNLWQITAQQTLQTPACNASQGDVGIGQQTRDETYGPLNLGCWYAGPKFFRCDGFCRSQSAMPHPNDLSSVTETCRCCDPEIIVAWDPVTYCEITLDSTGRMIWNDNIHSPYWAYKSCGCENRLGNRKKRQQEEPIENVWECREEKNTVFTSKCNPGGTVTICRSSQRLRLSQNTEQQYLRHIYNAAQAGNLDEFYPVNAADWYLEDYTPRDDWVLPPEIYRKTPAAEECDEVPTGCVIGPSVCGTIVFILIVVLVVLAVRKYKNKG